MKSKDKNVSPKTVVDLSLLAGLWLIHVINNWIWLYLDNHPPGWDSAHHLTMTLRWLAFWQNPSLAGLRETAAASSYPPLPYNLVIPFYPLFGRSADVATWASGSLWLGLLLVATYALGKEINSRGAGLSAAVLVSFYPLVVALEREFYLDLALTAVVTLAIWLLVRCGQFDNRQRAVSLGFALGLGTLIKWPFSFFLAGPILLTLFLVTRRSGWTRQRLVNLGLALTLMGAIAAGQYLFNFIFLPKNLYNLENVIQLVAGFAGAAGHPAWYTLKGLTYYATALINDQASLLFAIVFLASIPVFLVARSRGRGVLMAGIAIPYALATVLAIKEQRITMPYLPLMAVISGVGIMAIRRPKVRNTIAILVFFLGVLQYWANSYGVPFLPEELAVRNAWVEIYLFDQHLVRSPRDFQVNPARWGHEEILDVIDADAAERGMATPIQVPLVANTAAYNPNTFNYFSFREQVEIDFLYVWSWYGPPLDLENHPYQYLVIKSAANTEMPSWDQAGVEGAQVFLENHLNEFSCIFQSPLPDASEVRVYRRDSLGGPTTLNQHQGASLQTSFCILD